MNTDKTWQTSSTSTDQTEQLAEYIGRKLKGGEIIELASDLGGGKTTFVRGLARGLGSNDRVASPTFTISRVYTAGRIRMYHFDLYRLQEAGLVAEELADVVGDQQIVTVVEWGGIVNNVLPKERLTVHITRSAANDDKRELAFTYPETLAYLMEDVLK